MSDFQKGDKVMVTVPAVVTRTHSDGIDGINVEINNWHVSLDHSFITRSDVKVEKIPDVFVPGDTVRSKRCGYEYLVLKGGYVDLTHHIFNPGHAGSFTSKYYERVEV